jgi:hypothetical protein
MALLAARPTRSGVRQVSYNAVVRVPRGCSSMAEPQPSKLVMGVRFPSPAPLFRGGLSVDVSDFSTRLRIRTQIGLRPIVGLDRQPS